MTDMQTAEPRPVFASIGDGDTRFDFEEFINPDTLDFMESELGRMATALMMNYRCNMHKLAEADIPEQQKHDMRIVAKWAFFQKFIDLGVPKDLAWPFMSWAAGTVADETPAN